MKANKCFRLYASNKVKILISMFVSGMAQRGKKQPYNVVFYLKSEDLKNDINSYFKPKK